MINKKIVFVLGAGASCPYGYPSGAQLRKDICFNLKDRYIKYLQRTQSSPTETNDKISQIEHFTKTFLKSRVQSIDLFLANNRHLAPMGKYIIAFEVFNAEDMNRSLEHIAQGIEQDWYLYLFNRFIRGITTGDRLPDFSDGKIGFITFNYDRSLEYLLYESFRNSFTNIPEHEIYRCLKGIEIIHVYGQIAPLEWQNQSDYIGYGPSIEDALLRKVSCNIKTIYEEEKTRNLEDAHDMLDAAERVFCLGFGYAQENMNILKFPGVIKSPCCEIIGTAYGAEDKEVSDIHERIVLGLKSDPIAGKNTPRIQIKNMDCLKLLKNYL